MLIALSLLVALVGLLMFLICKHPDLKEVGHVLLQCGVLAFLLVGAEPLVRLLNPH